MSNDEEGYTIIEKKGERSMVMTPTKDEKILATLIYVTSFFTTVIAPTIIWLLKREESTFIDHHGKEYLNFAIPYFVYGVAAITVFVGIGVLLVPIVGLSAFIFTIIAAIKAYDGEFYRIPLIFRVL